MTVLWAVDVDYQSYFANVQLVHLLLGPATVALAVPLFRHRNRLQQSAVPVLFGLVAGSVVGLSTCLAISFAAGIDPSLTASLSTKSITAPVAMSVAQQVGGVPSLAAAFSVLTGMVGAAFGPWLLSKHKVHSPMERGLAMGATSHGQGTARALQECQETGAFAGLAMGLTALGMAILLPMLGRLVL